MRALWRGGLASAIVLVAALAFGATAQALPSTKKSNWPNSPVRHTLKQRVASTVPSFTENLRGNVLAVGNTLETCPQNQAATRRHLHGRAAEPCLGNNNNDENMVYVNVDSSGGHFDSSTATLTLPAGATVVKAFLYWAGDLSCGVDRPCDSTNPVQHNAPGGDSVSNNSLYTTVQLRVGSGSYSTVNATDPPRNGAWADVASWYSQPGNAPGDAYQVRADVTPELTAGLASRARRTARGQLTLPITVANVQAGTGYNRYAGWNLVVVWASPTAPWRDVTLFDGFDFVQVQAGDQLVVGPLDFTGFTTPANGKVDAQATVWATEGDRAITGDYLALGGLTTDCTTLPHQSDALHDVANFFNSTISTNGVDLGGRTPQYSNQLGFDLATLDLPEGTIPNAATGASVCLGTVGDTYFFGGIAFSTLIQAPNLNITKTASEANANPGDILSYTTTVTNSSTRDPTDPLYGTPVNAATNLLMGDPLPSGLDFVGFTINPGNVCGYNAVTRIISCNVGTLNPDAVFSYVYQARVAAVAVGAPSATLINDACYTSNSADQPTVIFEGCAQAPVVVPPGPPVPADLGVVKTVSDNTVAPGDTVTWTIVGTNYGPATSTGFVLADQLPAGVRFVSATASAPLTCTTPLVGASGGAVTCAAPSVPAAPAAGSTLTLRIVTTIDPTTPAGTILLNIATVNGDQPEPAPDPHPNRDTAAVLVVTPVNPNPTPTPPPDPNPNGPPEPPHPNVVPPKPPPGPAGTRLRLLKVGAPRTVAEGGTVSYLLRVSNIGEASSLKVHVCDTPPAGMSIVSAPGFKRSGHAVCTTISKLAVLAKKDFHLTARVTSGSNGVRTNRATVTASNAPSAHASAATRVIPAVAPAGRG
jgi:large repetitive protein